MNNDMVIKETTVWGQCHNIRNVNKKNNIINGND